MTHCRMEDLPKHLEDEVQRILDKMMSEGNPDDEMTDEEFNTFMWDNASEELHAVWTERRKTIEEARSRGAYAG